MNRFAVCLFPPRGCASIELMFFSFCVIAMGVSCRSCREHKNALRRRRPRNKAPLAWLEGLLLRAHSPVFAKAAADGKLCGQPVAEQARTSLPPPLQRRFFTAARYGMGGAHAPLTWQQPTPRSHGW